MRMEYLTSKKRNSEEELYAGIVVTLFLVQRTAAITTGVKFILELRTRLTG
jgi:hypothetical protein